jgi:hypothetical protein
LASLCLSTGTCTETDWDGDWRPRSGGVEGPTQCQATQPAWRLASLGGRRLFEARQRWSSSSSPPLGMPMWSKWRLGNCHKGVNRRISPPSCSNRSMASHSSIVVSSHIGGAVANDGGCWGYRRRKQVYLSNAWRLHTRSRFGIRLNGEGPRIW